MTGLIILNCGLSSSGKTTNRGNIITKSYRWTTRKPRKGEKDNRNATIEEPTDGIFVSEEEFIEKNNRGELVAVHHYPSKKNGHLYGFPVQEIISAVKRGEIIYEQIVDFNSIKLFEEAFEKIDINKSLYITNPFEVEKRLLFNVKEHTEERIKTNKKNMMLYLSNLESFDHIELKKIERVSDKKGIDNILKKLEDEILQGIEPTIEYDIFDGTIANIIKRYNEGTFSKEQVLVITDYLKKTCDEKQPLTRNYPTVDDNKYDNNVVNYIINNIHDSVSIPFMSAYALDRWGYAEEAKKTKDAVYNGIEKILADESPQTIIERNIHNHFVKEFNNHLEATAEKKLFELVRDNNFLWGQFITSDYYTGNINTIKEEANAFYHNTTSFETNRAGENQIETIEQVAIWKIIDNINHPDINEEAVKLFDIYLWDESMTRGSVFSKKEIIYNVSKNLSQKIDMVFKEVYDENTPKTKTLDELIDLRRVNIISDNLQPIMISAFSSINKSARKFAKLYSNYQEELPEIYEISILNDIKHTMDTAMLHTYMNTFPAAYENILSYTLVNNLQERLKPLRESNKRTKYPYITEPAKLIKEYYKVETGSTRKNILNYLTIAEKSLDIVPVEKRTEATNNEHIVNLKKSLLNNINHLKEYIELVRE